MVFGHTTTIRHWIPRVGWSIFTIVWSVETLFPDDIVDTTASHIFDCIFRDLITKCWTHWNHKVDGQTSPMVATVSRTVTTKGCDAKQVGDFFLKGCRLRLKTSILRLSYSKSCIVRSRWSWICSWRSLALLCLISRSCCWCCFFCCTWSCCISRCFSCWSSCYWGFCWSCCCRFFGSWSRCLWSFFNWTSCFCYWCFRWSRFLSLIS